MSTSDSSDRSARAPATRMMSEGVESGARRAIRSPAAFATPDLVGASEIALFVAAVRSGSESACIDFAQRLVEGGMTAETIYIDLLGPAARRMGELWESDVCDFLDVSVALGRLQRVLRSLSPVFLDEVSATTHVGSIILTSLPGHQHTFGLFVVAEFFVRAGWSVSIGAPVSNYDLNTALRADWFDVVAFSVALTDEIGRLTAEIRTARRNSKNPHVKILVGGRPFIENPDLAQRIGADGVATGDAREGPILARRLMQGATL